MSTIKTYAAGIIAGLGITASALIGAGSAAATPGTTPAPVPSHHSISHTGATHSHVAL